ncbi:MAG: XisI protein [Cyanobacteria bacterium P01_D01_bin.36]
MDKLATYKQAVRDLLSQYSQGYLSDEEVKTQLIFDDERGHYQWMDIGWRGSKRVYQCIVHFDIQDGRIWLQQNLTEQNPAEDLIKMGVAREDIVLGLQPPFKRPYTDYGVA